MPSALPARLASSSRSRATRPASRVPPSARVRRAARQQATAAASPATRGRTAGRAWRAQPRPTRQQTAPHRAPLALPTQDIFSALRRSAQRVCVSRGTLAKRARRARRASTRRRRAQTRARRVQRAQSRRQAATALRTACVWPATKSSRMIRRTRPCAPRVRWASTRRIRATLRARRARTIRPPSRQDLLAPVSVTRATKLRRRNAPHVLQDHSKESLVVFLACHALTGRHLRSVPQPAPASLDTQGR